MICHRLQSEIPVQGFTSTRTIPKSPGIFKQELATLLTMQLQGKSYAAPFLIQCYHMAVFRKTVVFHRFISDNSSWIEIKIAHRDFTEFLVQILTRLRPFQLQEDGRVLEFLWHVRKVEPGNNHPLKTETPLTENRIYFNMMSPRAGGSKTLIHFYTIHLQKLEKNFVTASSIQLWRVIL